MTTAERFERSKRLFLEACERALEERAGYLDQACAGDPALRREVEALLSLDAQPAVLELSPDPPKEVGPYRLLRRVGEGGMGEVWEAEQVRPVHRRVALKLIKWGMDTREVLARFESERQALELMNHPNIARAYGAGSTEGGRPFFAMEYVEGVRLDQHCDRERLSTRERLELFVKVCDGVQHAHHKGIIHRDIKPSNILVAIQDDRPVPKIIDFGVAKATSQRLTERTLFTELGQWIGTPEYMSPEQAELTGLDIDTRSDVYSLGVVLYELLVGAQPFDSTQIRSAGFDEMRRCIRQIEPPRPSSRFSSLGDEASEVALQRRTDRRGLMRVLRGDFDWIVMKAMEKDRNRRYSSPSELAADVGRYLRNELVEASPPSTVDRMRKFIARNRGRVAAAALVVITLLAGVIGTGVGLVRARQEADTARRVSELLSGVFADVDPAAQLGALESPIALLDRGAERIERDLSDQPELQAHLLRILGDGYRSRGRYEESRKALEASLRLREQVLPATDPAIGASQTSLGLLEYWVGNLAASLAHFERAEAVFRAWSRTNPAPLASTLALVGAAHWRLGEYGAAQEAFEESLEIYRTSGLGEDQGIATTYYHQALLLIDLAEFERARALLERALEILQQVLGPDHTAIGWISLDLGQSYLGTLRYDEAKPLLERALAIQERAFGSEHVAVAAPLASLAVIDRSQGRSVEARARLERALGIFERVQGPDHPDLVNVLVSYSWTLQDAREFERSREVIGRAVRIAESVYGELHLSNARAIEALGFHYYHLREYREALRYYQQALSIRSQVFGPGHRALGWNLYDQACILALAGDAPAAFETLRQAVATGWASARLFEDGDLDSLRDDPRFSALEEEVRSRL